MRYPLALAVFATACMELPAEGRRYDSVRDRLSDASTSLYVRDEASAGAITAQRRGGDGWIPGTANLAVERGYVRATIDDTGQLVVSRLEVEIAPLTLDAMLDRPAELQDIRLLLTAPVRGDAIWTSTDDAAATVMMAFAFEWKIAVDGGEAYPLATRQLPLEAVRVVLGGSGEHVDARLELAAAGELWNWADLVQITDLSLSLSAETAD